MPKGKPADPIFVIRAAEHILAHLDQHAYSGNELASDLKLSREQTHRKLKQETNLSTGKFISFIRLLIAYHQLVTSRDTIAEISYKVGFESPAYFNKCFREAFGIPPGNVRKNGVAFSVDSQPILEFYQVPEVRKTLEEAGFKLDVTKNETQSPGGPVKKIIGRVKSIGILTLLIVIVIMGIGIYFKTTRPFPGFSTSPDGRIAIIPFQNQTGDSLLAPIGEIASSWISSQLEEISGLKIVPYLTIKEYLPYKGILPDDPEGRPTLGEVVHAKYFITGDYFLKSGKLHVASHLVDAFSQESVHSLPVISGPKDSVMHILDEVRLKIAGLLSNLEEVETGKLNPPDYQAYVHYLQGLDGLTSSFYPDESRRHFEKASELEPNFVMPKLFLTWFYRGEKLDSIFLLLSEMKNTTRYEKNVCDEVTHTWRRNYKESLRIAIKMLHDYPEDYYFNLIAGHRAKAQFMPQLSLDVLSKLKDPLEKDVGLVWYYYKIWNVTGSLMMQGKYNATIEYLNSIPEEFHNRAIPGIYIAAYVASGKSKEEVEELINRYAVSDPKFRAEYYTAAAYEFSLASEQETSRYFATKALEIMDLLNEKDLFYYDRTDVLFLAGDYKSAKARLEKDIQGDPGNLELKVYLAYVEASLGSPIAAKKIFSGIDSPLVFFRRNEFSYQTDYLKARMLALSGEKNAAIALLKSALAKGQFCHNWDFDRDVFLRNLFHEPAFKSMVSPKDVTKIP
jgi:AraC-like DNA-binding protein/tetratricopeptide (TPR) repeat protein/TolB-like protein